MFVGNIFGLKPICDIGTGMKLSKILSLEFVFVFYFNVR